MDHAFSLPCSTCVSSNHEIKIVLWGNCALRFNGSTKRILGQEESAVAIFVGTTVQEYDGAFFFVQSFGFLPYTFCSTSKLILCTSIVKALEV